MDVSEYAGGLRFRVAAMAEAAGEDASAVVDRLMVPLDAAIRLTLLEVLSAAAAEITRELAPTSVELRLRGRDPEFVVTSPPPDAPGDTGPTGESPAVDSGDGQMARINLRLPDGLKGRVEEAADRDGLSINAWLVRAASAALDRSSDTSHRERPSWKSSQRYTGWAR
ncbi:MAG: hypothetical protein J2P57_16660 [Acidimicrobiaceae bacterium]|nr:hypothetical protein [Acidimicrobiaceae bacterium]